ncbi:MAG: hypothetical protein V1874_04545 [Spirochaetota bacterium]
MNFNEIISSYNRDGKLKKYCDLIGMKNLVPEIMQYLDSTEDGIDFVSALMILVDLSGKSDLTDDDYSEFLSRLKGNSFFPYFKKFLYHEQLTWKSFAIFTIGKFPLPENSVYLEEAFLNTYYMNNPVLAARSLDEIARLRSDNYEQLHNMLIEKHDIINFMSYGIELLSFMHKDELYKELLDEYKERNIKVAPDNANEAEEFFSSYDKFVFNVQQWNNLNDWSREQYIESINFFIANRSKINMDTKEDYFKIINNIFK